MAGGNFVSGRPIRPRFNSIYLPGKKSAEENLRRITDRPVFSDHRRIASVYAIPQYRTLESARAPGAEISFPRSLLGHFGKLDTCNGRIQVMGTKASSVKRDRNRARRAGKQPEKSRGVTDLLARNAPRGPQGGPESEPAPPPRARRRYLYIHSLPPQRFFDCQTR